MHKFYLFFLLMGLLTSCTPNREAEASTEAELPPPAQAQGNLSDPPKFILDTDSANEIDDLYAMARLLPDTTVDLLGISSAQWFHHYSGDSTVYQSQRLNEEILALSGKSSLPHPTGADRIMGDPWGGYAPRKSPATDFIIKSVKDLPPGEKLVVMSLGAGTNLASAIALDTSIAPKIVAYMLGFQYDVERGIWNKDEFNIRRDLNAANYLLNRADLEFHVMPISVAREYTWQREDVFRRLAEKGALGEYLREKWMARFSENDAWVMWDVALLQAFLHPEMAEEIIVSTPPENNQRSIYLYSDIDFDQMYADFWSGW